MENLITYDFGYAIKELKKGFKVRRQSWNGKGMWLFLVKANHYELDLDFYKNGALAISQYIGIKTVDNKFIPWVPSQADVLAIDWGRA